MPKINASLGDKKIEFNIKEFLAKHKLIWVFALLVAAAAGIFSWRATQNYTGSLALTISRSGTQNAIDYKFDSYYALKATDEFGSTVVGWFKTPEIASVINARLGIDSSGWSLSALSGKFKAAKISPNLVEVRYGATSQDDVKKIASAVSQVIAEKVNLLNSSSGQGLAFVVIAGEPVAVKNTYNLLLGVLAGFLVGLVFGFFIMVARDYFYR
ncbi:hypothetical protein KJ853_04080 [Patescibacteria group bacterium]|nr:hypothetical protein [Patescibacteria group bacterium]